MRGFYKRGTFPNIHGGPRYQVENTTRLQQRMWGVECRPEWTYNREPQEIESQEEKPIGDNFTWESFRVIDWRG